MNSNINANTVNEEVHMSEYTIDNPKIVVFYCDFKGKDTFTGVVKDEGGAIAHYVDGKYHRENEPAIMYLDGSNFWHLNGKLHRTDGPALEWLGNKQWHLNSKLHRTDGPAIEHADGRKGWWFNGKIYGENGDFTNESWIAHVATLT